MARHRRTALTTALLLFVSIAPFAGAQGPADLPAWGTEPSPNAGFPRNELAAVDALATLVDQKIAELRTTLEWYERFEIPRALDVVRSDEAAAVMQSQVDGLRAQGYRHSEVLHSEVTVLNSTSALYRASLSRRNVDGGEFDRPTITYLVTDDVAGLRIVLLAVQGQ